MQTIRQGLWAVHSAVLLFGLTALFPRVIELSATEINLLRSVFAAGVLWPLLRWARTPLGLRARGDYAVAFVLGTLLAGHWVSYFHAMQIASVAVGVVALFTFPVITVFLEPLFHGERPRAVDIASALVVLLGIYLLVPQFSLSDATTRGVLWGMVSALLFALRNIVQRRYFASYPARQALLYQTLVTLIVLLPVAGAVVPEVSAPQWGQLLLLGVVFTALPHTLFAVGLRHFSAKTASLIACLQVVYATAFAALLLGEWPALTTLIGGTLVVGAAIVETYSTGRRR